MRSVLSYATEFDFHEGHQIARALLQLGHDVRVVNADVEDATSYWPAARTYLPDADLDEVLGPGGADLFLYLEPRGLLPRGLERASCHTACNLCDTMLSLEPRVDLSRLFDDVLLSHPHALQLLPHDPARVHWTPLAVDPAVFCDRGGARDLDVAFVGSTDSIWAPRRRLLERIARRYRTNDFFAPRCAFEEIAGIYNRARIVVHLPIFNALNPRVFEAMGCGALLVTGRADNRLESLFADGTHLVTFGDEDEAIATIDHYLAHEDERTRIARAGCEEVHRSHTYAERFRGLPERLTSRARAVAPARAMGREAVEDIYQRRHKQAGQVEALLRRAGREPRFSAARYRALARAGATFLRRSGLVF